MAFTPSKDHKRIAREQRKRDKRRVREEAKAEKLAAQKAAAVLAAEEAEDQLLRNLETCNHPHYIRKCLFGFDFIRNIESIRFLCLRDYIRTA